MLVHQAWTTEAVASDTVVLTDREVDRVRTSGTCHSGIKIDADGILYLIQADAGFSAVGGEWLVSGTASTFYVQHTILSGTLELDPAEATWNQLNVDRIYDNQLATSGLKTTEVFFEISSDVSGVPVVASATMTFRSEQGNQ